MLLVVIFACVLFEILRVYKTLLDTQKYVFPNLSLLSALYGGRSWHRNGPFVLLSCVRERGGKTSGVVWLFGSAEVPRGQCCLCAGGWL